MRTWRTKYATRNMASSPVVSIPVADLLIPIHQTATNLMGDKSRILASLLAVM